MDLDGKSLQEEQKETHQRKWKRSKGVDRTEMRKEEKRLRCALLDGSAWSTEKKYMRRYTGTFDILFGKGAQIEEGGTWRNKIVEEAKEGWRFAASASRITDETAEDEDRKHTSGGVVGGN